jgi:DUF971 family protein
MATKTELWPTELRLRADKRALIVTFDNGERYELDAEYLRVESPSAEVQGHSPEQRRWVGGKKNVGIREIAPVGNYAARIAFDDGHDTGIYSWETLRHLGLHHDEIWAHYLANISTRGMTR